MGNPIVSPEFIRLMDKRLREVGERKYTELPRQKERLFRIMPSDSAWEEFFNVGAVPDIPEFSGKVQYLAIAPGYHTKIEPKEYAGGLQFERKLLDDKKYSVFDDRTAGLMESAVRVQGKSEVQPFAFAFSSAYDFMTSEEGVALCSGSHTTKSGSSTSSGFDNAGTSALSKTSVAATRLLMRRFRNDISERVAISDQLALVVPDNLADKAMEITETPKGLNSAEGNVNKQFGRYEVIPLLRLDDTSTTDWFMTDMVQQKRDLIWIDRIMPDINNTVDFESFIWKVSLYMRFAYGWLDWRWIYGHNVA